LVDQAFQHAALVLGAFKFARIEALALLLARLHPLLLEAGTELVAADLFVFPQQRYRPPAGRTLPPRRRRLDLGDVVGAHATEVALVDDEEERNHQQADDDRRGPARGPSAEFLQHCWPVT